jgi:hypothetical protein
VRQGNTAAFDGLREHWKRISLLVSSLALTAIALALDKTERGPAQPTRESLSCDVIEDAAIQFICTSCHRALGSFSIHAEGGLLSEG